MELKIEAQTDSRDSFRSYIAGFEYSGSSNPSAGESPALSLLNGELVCCQCEDVTLYLPFRDSLFGNLYCTNFRICFTPAIELRKEPCCSRSLVFSDDLQLPLCSVERILYSSLSITTKNFASSGKFRLISCPLSQLDGVSAVKVFSKDFRSWTFDLQHSQLAVNFANHVLHFSRPRSPSNFFRVSFIASDPSLAAFNNCCDWQKELSRCHVHFDQWRVCSLKALDQYYRNPVESYPSHVVVPYVLETRVILEALIPCWNNGRFPVWCWSSSYGSALLRSSYCCNDIESEDPWDIISPLIAKVHPRTRRPRILDVESSSAMIASSYQKLRELCSIETSSQFSRLEKKWYSLMDETGWCALVYSCLHSARKVIHLLIDNQQSVVVTDEDGFGASTVVCCLAQICVDEYYRTVEGLNRLIDREWSAMGYPFGQNMFKRGDSVHNEPQNEAPTVATFLLFLDAVSQLIRLHPYSFEYSQYMLIALWDLSITGIAPGLTFNTVDERIAENRLEPTFPLSKYYSSKYCLMFANVDYCTGCVCGIAETKETIIRPSSCPADVEFWTDCYLRWVPPANIMNGGKVAHDIAQSSTLSATVAVDCDPIVWRQEHHPGFEYDDIASSFPFSNTVFTVSSNTNNERMNMDDTASLCSLGTNIDLFGPNINSTKGQKRAERRYSTSSMLSRMSDLVDRAKGDHATRYNPRLHELNPHRNVSCLPEYVESSSNPVLRYSSALEPSANQCSSSYDTRLPNSAFDTLV